MSESDNPGDQNPLERLLVAEPDDRPEQVELEAGEVISVEEFLDRLEELATAADQLNRLAGDLDSLQRTGLREDDVVSLLYGRNSQLRKSTIESVLENVDDVSDQLDGGPADRRDLLVRLVAGVGNMAMSDVEEVFEELDRLHDRYGGPEGLKDRNGVEEA